MNSRFIVAPFIQTHFVVASGDLFTEIPENQNKKQLNVCFNCHIYLQLNCLKDKFSIKIRHNFYDDEMLSK